MENKEMIEELNNCAMMCNICYNACLNETDIDLMARCIELDRECADTCQLTASIVARDSENMDRFLRLCVEMCRVCAEECEKHTYDHCRQCAKACWDCYKTCNTHLENKTV